jgi:hypothetical protein
MKHYHQDVPGIGNVAISRHAQVNCTGQRIADSHIDALLNHGARTDIEGGCVQLDHAGIRAIVVRRPEPFSGAALMVTVFRVERKARAR